METITTTRTAHEILKDFCKVRNVQSSYYPSKTQTTNRSEFIANTLTEMGIDHVVDSFEKRNEYLTYTINKNAMNELHEKSLIRKFLERTIELSIKRENNDNPLVDLEIVKYITFPGLVFSS